MSDRINTTELREYYINLLGIGESSTPTITPINSSRDLYNSTTDYNQTLLSIYNTATALEAYYYDYLYILEDYYQKYYVPIKQAFEINKTEYGKWDDFYTTVKENSAKWIKPMSISYPTIIQYPINNDNIEQIRNWLRTYFPIKNTSDETINYVENSVFYVTCYIYQIQFDTNILDQPSSQCNCTTQSGALGVHCQTIVTGGWIQCNQGGYNCNTTYNCYKSQNVDCWFTTPYLKSNGTPIAKTDPINQKQSVISKIQTNLTMKYKDRRETDLQTLIFRVEDCDWIYVNRL
jgi:hypothetical protein